MGHPTYYLYARVRGEKKQFIQPILQQLFQILLQLLKNRLQVSTPTSNSPELHTLLSPEPNTLIHKAKRVAGALQPPLFSYNQTIFTRDGGWQEQHEDVRPPATISL